MADDPQAPDQAAAPLGDNVPQQRPHLLRANYDGGSWSVTVDCPDEALGADRPCGVWEDGDGAKRLDACTFQQYATDLDPEEWLHGQIDFEPVPIIEGGYGEEWHAKLAPADHEWHATVAPADSVRAAARRALLASGIPEDAVEGFLDLAESKGRELKDIVDGRPWGRAT